MIVPLRHQRFTMSEAAARHLSGDLVMPWAPCRRLDTPAAEAAAAAQAKHLVRAPTGTGRDGSFPSNLAPASTSAPLKVRHISRSPGSQKSRSLRDHSAGTHVPVDCGSISSGHIRRVATTGSRIRTALSSNDRASRCTDRDLSSSSISGNVIRDTYFWGDEVLRPAR